MSTLLPRLVHFSEEILLNGAPERHTHQTRLGALYVPNTPRFSIRA